MLGVGRRVDRRTGAWRVALDQQFLGHEGAQLRLVVEEVFIEPIADGAGVVGLSRQPDREREQAGEGLHGCGTILADVWNRRKFV